MSLRDLQVHHHALRIRPGTEDASVSFFRDVLGLAPDPGTRSIPDVAIQWLDVGDDAQIHLFAVEGRSPYDRDGRDPFTPHIALGCPDIDEAEAELVRLGVDFWTAGKGAHRQLFTDDPSGNMIELHQVSTCRCQAGARSPVDEQP